MKGPIKGCLTPLLEQGPLAQLNSKPRANIITETLNELVVIKVEVFTDLPLSYFPDDFEDLLDLL